jgi:hypothetical protein
VGLLEDEDAVKKLQTGSAEDGFSPRVIHASQEIRDRRAEDRQKTVFYLSCFCHVGFPIRRVKGPEYIRTSGPHMLSILAPSSIGIPFGVFPRMAISWIVTEVKIRQENSEDTSIVHLGDNFAAFIRNVTGAKSVSGGQEGNITRFRQQYVSLLASTIVYAKNPKLNYPCRPIGPIHWTIGDLLWSPQPQLVGNPQNVFRSSIRLGQNFLHCILHHGVPLDELVLRHLYPKVLAIDIYIWATYKAFEMRKSFDKTVSIPWDKIKVQFGGSYKDDYEGVRIFRRRVLEACNDVKRVFPSFNFGEWKPPAAKSVTNDKGGIRFCLPEPSVSVKPGRLRQGNMSFR